MAAAIWLTAPEAVDCWSAGWTCCATCAIPSRRICSASSRFCWAPLTSSGTSSPPARLSWFSALSRAPSTRRGRAAATPGGAATAPCRPPLSLRRRRLSATLVNFVEERQAGPSLLGGLRGSAVLPHVPEEWRRGKPHAALKSLLMGTRPSPSSSQPTERVAPGDEHSSVEQQTPVRIEDRRARRHREPPRGPLILNRYQLHRRLG